MDEFTRRLVPEGLWESTGPLFPAMDWSRTIIDGASLRAKKGDH